MGKTSLADFVKDYLDFEKGIIGVYVSNKIIIQLKYWLIGLLKQLLMNYLLNLGLKKLNLGLENI